LWALVKSRYQLRGAGFTISDSGLMASKGSPFPFGAFFLVGGVTKEPLPALRFVKERSAKAQEPD
jgi:hypothetical protein